MDAHLLALGAGHGSGVEQIKSDSALLRGNLADELANDATRFSDESSQLLKFHGSYQQEDRDVRAVRKALGQEKAYEFMVRSRIPGGRLTAGQ